MKGDSRFLEQEWAQLCRGSVCIAIFRNVVVSLSRQQPLLKTVYLPPVEFSRGNLIYFVSLETLRASNRPVERGHARLLYQEDCEDLSLRSFSNSSFTRNHGNSCIKDSNIFIPSFFSFFTFFHFLFFIGSKQRKSKIFLLISRTNVIISSSVDLLSFGGIFGSMHASPPIICSSRRENARGDKYRPVGRPFLPLHLYFSSASFHRVNRPG